MFEKYSDVVGVNELCDMLNIGKNTAYKLINSGEMVSLRIGRCIKIPKICVINYCLENTDLNKELIITHNAN